MQISTIARRLLQSVFSLSASSSGLTRPRLERHLSVSPEELQRALIELARRGWLDAQRLRLTLPGLAVAAAASRNSRSSRSSRAATTKARPSPATFGPTQAAGLPILLFSPSEAPRAVA